MSEQAGRRRWLAQATAGLARRPDLWGTALWQLRVLAPERWWSKMPPVPAPSRDWLGFRMETAYGDKTARPSARELVEYLEWCRESHKRASRMR